MNPISYDMVKLMMREREMQAVGHRGASSSAALLRSAARRIAHRTRRGH